MDYADWMMEFDSRANTDRGFPDEELDQELLDELYDEGLDVEEALDEYLKRRL